jgi:hypothetical protein
MRVIIFLLLGMGVLISARFERGTVIKKEELRSLPDKMRQEKLASAVYDLVDEVIRYARMFRIEYKRTICDRGQFLSDDDLKDFLDDEIVGRLRPSLVDSQINITRSYCNNCAREGYTMKSNCRILLVEW